MAYRLSETEIAAEKLPEYREGGCRVICGSFFAGRGGVLQTWERCFADETTVLRRIRLFLQAGAGFYRIVRKRTLPVDGGEFSFYFSLK